VPSPDGPLGPLAGRLAAASLALARRFAGGGTLWCWSPRWPHHARHVAVEFVHPVVVGARAFPAVAVVETDAVAALRHLVGPGDAIVVVGGSVEEVVPVLRRAPAWGVLTLWVGAGAGPAVADHELALPGGDSAFHSGEVVLLYHLLWELTQVCFEHPGLLAPAPAPVGEVCVTCSDAARLGEVVVTSPGDMATVRTAEGREEIDTTLVGTLRAGDLVLVHAGTAIDVVAIDVVAVDVVDIDVVAVP